ncbi:MAG TPA: methionyl-tRNA formyltransferase [Candidatus Limnocylindria bacterium]|nr:methionyl-tRNA formyltransferase [Candidatus Limnocylindria bacterium]
MTRRVVFLGTPAFAVPSLDALAALAGREDIDLVGVVTQPDRPGDRGRVEPSAVKRRATELGLAVLQPVLLNGDAVRSIADLRPAALVWAAYGNLIPRRLIDSVDGRAVNVHASLLPRWRGAAPIARAILAGDPDTGVTLMQGTASLDRGPVIASATTPIGPVETAGELTERLARLGGALLERELPAYLAERTRPVPQDESRATWAPKLTTADGQLRLAEPAEALARRIRAMTPEPGAWTTFHGRRLGVLRATVTGGHGVEHGTLALRDGVPHVAAGAGWLRLDEVQPAGKRAMSGADWARGLRLEADATLGR